MVVLSFRDYFLFVPFKNGVDFLSVMGALSIVGWVLLILGPPFLLANRTVPWGNSRVWLLIATSTLWTFSTLLIKIYGLIAFGQFWGTYLIYYPILFLVEWVLPIFYVAMAFKLRKSEKIRQIVG